MEHLKVNDILNIDNLSPVDIARIKKPLSIHKPHDSLIWHHNWQGLYDESLVISLCSKCIQVYPNLLLTLVGTKYVSVLFHLKLSYFFGDIFAIISLSKVYY